MGACASVPKDLKAEAGAAPLPEQPKEETTTEEEQVATGMNADEGEKKVDCTANDKPKKDDDVAKEEKVADEDDKHQSLNSLMNDQDEVKQESTTTTGAAAVPSTTVKADEDKNDETHPVYDSPTKKDEPVKPSTDTSEVTKEENKKEETTQKS